MIRSAPLRRNVRVKRTNPRRRAAEFARCYGSEERVLFVKAGQCAAPDCISRGRCHNAHTESGGAGRKADARTIAGLCAKHHRAFDQYLPPFDKPDARALIKLEAARIDALWKNSNNHPTETARQ